MYSIQRKSHFLGTKIKSLRKRNNLTLEDLSIRCIQMNPESAPSISYLSMIENGKRVPSEDLVDVIATIFQKQKKWFFDESLDAKAIDPTPETSAVKGMPLEPGFLFSDQLLQSAIPEMLSQTGTTGRQFAHILIRAHQESNQNRYPDIERAADSVGLKRFPLTLQDLMDITKRLGIKIKWFESETSRENITTSKTLKTVVRSFFDTPNIIYLNNLLKKIPARLKYDLANQIGHFVLHAGDGARGAQVSGGKASVRRDHIGAPNMDAKDILFAWRDFECSYFAAALLCPKTSFRQFLAKNSYSIDIANKLELTTALIMRRMTSVSPYPHWHYFDAYPPGNLRAVYRGNGIPIPWGNMTSLSEPCEHWAVFRMLYINDSKPSSQISILNSDEGRKLYSCNSIRRRDAAGNWHVICAGLDLKPALLAQGYDAEETINLIFDSCNGIGGSGRIPEQAKVQIRSISKILNVGWISEGTDRDATVICPRGTCCFPEKSMDDEKPKLKKELDKIRMNAK